MRPTRERQGQPDRSRTGVSRSIPDRKVGDNPRRGKPDRSRVGAKRPPNPVELVKIRKDELRASDSGLSMVQAGDASEQRTLLEFSAVGTSMVKAADVAAQRALLEYSSTDSSKGAALVGVEDAGNVFTGNTVEAVLAELRASSIKDQQVLAGDNPSSSATAIELHTSDGLAFGPGDIGVPVATSVRATSVAISWMASSEPSNWTLRLHKRTGGGTLNEVATFTVNTS